MKQWLTIFNKTNFISFLSLFCLFPVCVFADPPFIADDPYITEEHHLEIYLFGSMIKTIHTNYILFPAIELDYGLSEQIQLHLIPAIATYVPPKGQGKRDTAQGDTEFNVKIQLQKENVCRPEIAFEPTFEIPTGTPALSNGKMWMKMPIWIGKIWPDWKTYGGLGYAINPAAHTRNFYFGGWVLQHGFTENLNLGAEIYMQGKSANTRIPAFRDYGSFTLLNLGMHYQIATNFIFLMGTGHSFRGTPQWVGYIGLYWNINLSPDAKTGEHGRKASFSRQFGLRNY